MTPEPAPENDYLLAHASLLLSSYRLRTGRDLVESGLSRSEAAHFLYFAPFVVLSHDVARDPRFTYANLSAQACFEMGWSEIVGLPSRYSAEPVAQAERDRLLREVVARGFIDDYSGVRIARGGRRFLIHNATVWNLTNEGGQLCGQAAMFSRWHDLTVPDSV